MILSELIERARNRTIARLQESIKDKENISKVHVEPAMRDRDGNVVHAPDGLKLPLRWDYYAEASPDEKNADSITLKMTDPVFAEWEHGMRIEIISVCWDCMIFRLSPTMADADWSFLSAWFMAWFDPEDLKPKCENGLYEVVHFVSDPEIHAGVARFIVDFGSAKIGAFISLLDLTSQHGFSLCQIGENEQPQQADPPNSHAFGTFVTHPAAAGSAPKASGSR